MRVKHTSAILDELATPLLIVLMKDCTSPFTLHLDLKSELVSSSQSSAVSLSPIPHSSIPQSTRVAVTTAECESVERSDVLCAI